MGSDGRSVLENICIPIYYYIIINDCKGILENICIFFFYLLLYNSKLRCLVPFRYMLH